MIRAAPAAFIVHSRPQAWAALAAGTARHARVLLLSARGAGVYAGPGWFMALIAAARDHHPQAFAGAILDCDDDEGAVLAAIRAGIEAIAYAGPPTRRKRLNEIAMAAGLSILPRGALWRWALDLDHVPARRRQDACADWIEQKGKRR